MGKKIIKLTESDLTRIVKRVIAEQEDGNYKKGIQCFLNKRGIKDDSGQSLKIDGSIGNYPNSKTAQTSSTHNNIATFFFYNQNIYKQLKQS